MKQYRANILAVMMAVFLSFLPPGEAYASSDSGILKKEVEYQGRDKAQKADAYFQKKIVEDGSTWNLQEIRYEIVKEEPVMVSEPVTETVKSGVVNAGETYLPAETVSKEGITYKLSETTENEVVVKAKSAPATKFVTATDRRTGEDISMKCGYVGITRKTDTWEDTHIDITFVSYDADTFQWNQVTVPKNRENPLKGYEDQLLKSVGGSRDNYRIRNIHWAGRAYKNEKGVLCRNARAEVSKRTKHYRVNYSGESIVEDIKGTVYTSVYTGLKETDSGERNYTIRAVAVYAKQRGIPVMGITLGLLLILLIVVGIVFILKKKQKPGNKTAEQAGRNMYP